MIKVEIKHKPNQYSDNLKALFSKNEIIKKSLINKTCKGNEFIGWLTWPNDFLLKMQIGLMDKYIHELKEIGIKTIVVIGIGGSFIGTKAILDLCYHKNTPNDFEIIFVSGIYEKKIEQLKISLNNKNWALVVISKSGTTFETAINFRIFRELLKQHYPNEYDKHIITITDQNIGKMHELSEKNHWKSLIIPNDIGGRFSAITPVGLFIFRLANLDIKKILEGWMLEIDEFIHESVQDNKCFEYANFRYLMNHQYHKNIEVFCTYEESMRYFAEQYKQIFAESEGKKVNILIPTIANYSDDLHSIGQLYQQGPHNFFETHLNYDKSQTNCTIPQSGFNNDDDLDELSNWSIHDINKVINEAVIKAHEHIYSLSITISDADEINAGRLLAFLCLSASISSLLNDVNPFDQPGVETYKANIKKIIKRGRK